MSKTHKDVVRYLDKQTSKKREGGASARFKREQLRRKTTERLFKREVNFTNYIIQSSQED
jgi:hypothetical protein